MKEFSWGSLHFITKLIVFAAGLRLVADTLQAVRDLSHVREGAPVIDWLISVAHAYGYSLIFFGTAATVELLFRIWREFRLLRVSGATAGERPASEPTDPPTQA